MAQQHNEEMISAPMTRYGRMTLESQRQQLRSDAFTAAEWAEHNPILQLGELGAEKDTNKIKIGDGVSEWNDLAYAGGSAVTSVNGKTGTVVLNATDVSALPQYDTMPTASADNEGQIVQFTGTTDANYTNGYIYKCAGAGEPVVYSWTRVDVQPAPSGLPDQTGQSGKFLSTDGTDASWSDKPLVNTATGSWSITIGSTNAASNNSAINIGAFSQASDNEVVVVGVNASANRHGTAIGNAAKSQFHGTEFSYSDWTIAIGYNAQAFAKRAIQLGPGTNSDVDTFKVSNGNGNFEIMNATGNIPADRIASTTGLADGNYKPRLTMSGGVPTITWVAE